MMRLRANRSDSSSVFTTIVHNYFICSRIDYCNSLSAEFPKARLSSLQKIAIASEYCHISVRDVVRERFWRWVGWIRHHHIPWVEGP